MGRRAGAARADRASMLLSALWDDGTTAAQLPVDAKKTNEIPVFRDLLDKIPSADLKGAVVSADQMHTQREHARKITGSGAFFILTIGAGTPAPKTSAPGASPRRPPKPPDH